MPFERSKAEVIEFRQENLIEEEKKRDSKGNSSAKKH